MPSWLGELTKVPSHEDHQDLPRRCMPPSRCLRYATGQGGGQLLCAATGASLYQKVLIHAPEGREVWLTRYMSMQLHHTLAYARALQHWAEEVQPSVLSQPRHLVGSVLELWQAMDPLITFVEGDLFITTALSRWMEITLPQLTKVAQPPRRHSHSSRAHPRGSLSATHSKGQPTATTT